MACRRRCLWAEFRIPISSRSWSSTTLLPCRGTKQQRRLTFVQDLPTQSEQYNSVWVYNSGGTQRSLSSLKQRFSSDLFASFYTQVVYKRTKPMRLMTYHMRFQSKASPWMRLVFLVAKRIFIFHKELYLWGKCFCNVVRQLDLGEVTLTIRVAPKDFTAAVLQLPAGPIPKVLVSMNHLCTKTCQYRARFKNTGSSLQPQIVCTMVFFLLNTQFKTSRLRLLTLFPVPLELFGNLLYMLVWKVCTALPLHNSDRDALTNNTSKTK